MSTVTVLTAAGEEISFPKEVDEDGRTWIWRVEALADGSLLLALVFYRPHTKGQQFVTKQRIRLPKGSWIAQRWETARYSKRDRLTNQIVM